MNLNISELPIGLLTTSPAEKVVSINDELLALVGGTTDDWLGKTMDSFLTKASTIFCQTHVWPLLRKESEAREIFLQILDKDGNKVPVMISAKAVAQPGGNRYIWLFFVAHSRSRYEAELLEARKRADQMAAELAKVHAQLQSLHAKLESRVEITEHENRELSQLSYTDSLTNLGNRRSLSKLAQDLRHPGHSPFEFSVLMIDVDNFKSVNDTYGHEQGDAVLVAIGLCLQSAARHGDFVVRYGGEEFAIILPGADRAQSIRAARRVHELIAQSQPGGLAATVSIGAATSNFAVTHELSAVLKLADKAVYAAKNLGRNQTIHANDLS